MSYSGWTYKYDDLDEANYLVPNKTIPLASFTATNFIHSGTSIAFNNTTTCGFNPDTFEYYNWTIGFTLSGVTGNYSYISGTTYTSKNPVIYFKTNDDYSVWLRAGNSYGFSDYFMEIYVGAPIANFTYSGQTHSGSTISFTDTSTGNPTSWLWNVSGGTYIFTGSTTSVNQNTKIILKQDKTYTITLQSTNKYGTTSISKNITITS